MAPGSTLEPASPRGARPLVIDARWLRKSYWLGKSAV